MERSLRPGCLLLVPTHTQLSHSEWGEGNTSSLFLYITATVHESPGTGDGDTQGGAGRGATKYELHFVSSSGTSLFLCLSFTLGLVTLARLDRP